MTGHTAPMHVRRLALALGYLLVVRLIFAARVELMPEETYYWNYSRHLDIGYLDHPPLIAWLIRAGTTLFGNTAFGVRVGALCCGVATAFFVYRLARNIFGDTVALYALLLAQALPFFFFSGVLMTPDAPLTAAWAATAYFLERALVADHSRAWIGVGVAMGLGLLSKYTIGLLGVAAAGFMVMDRPSRRWFGRWQPYAAGLTAIALFAPVILWNSTHEWASFVFQTSRRLAEAPRFSLHRLIGAAIVLITPAGVLGVTAALRGRAGYANDGTTAPEARRSIQLLRFALAVPLAVFVLFSLRHEVKLDWTGAPWAAALPLMALTMGEPRARQRWTWLRVVWPPTIAVLLLLYGVGLCYLVAGIPGVGISERTELIPMGWRDLGRQVDALAANLRRPLGDQVLVVGMDRYAIASELAFYAPDQSQAVQYTTTGHLLGGMGLMYERWFPIEEQAGKTLLLVAWDRNSLADSQLSTHFRELDARREGMVFHDGAPVRRYYYRVAHGYIPN